jgi:hypothetical protein
MLYFEKTIKKQKLVIVERFGIEYASQTFQEFFGETGVSSFGRRKSDPSRSVTGDLAQNH